MATNFDKIYDLLYEMNGRMTVIEEIIPIFNEVNKVVIIGNGERPLRTSVRELVKLHEDEKAAKEKCEEEARKAKIKLEEDAVAAKIKLDDDARDTKKKIKLLFVGAIISFAVVQVGGWAVSYFTLLAAITK